MKKYYLNDGQFLMDHLDCSCENKSIYTSIVYTNPANHQEVYDYPLENSFNECLKIKCNNCGQEKIFSTSYLAAEYIEDGR